ncbi:hypothetical protein C9374_002257 [Naegleria lovaniensis]|uniref:Uncharacterized protein n=1 Tax=Naegleria lovaniensis TaxID=51637 RepID=A0AA88KLB6_NAELO|nr:uncharacterized protein C9374_002257 [Naegleria lovaniensis]KAG2386513.1 hypothetical protein C9374_002257 [Naegleria lovaniensis]
MKRVLCDESESKNLDATSDDDLTRHHDEIKKRKISIELSSALEHDSNPVKVLLIDFVMNKCGELRSSEASKLIENNNIGIGRLKHKLMNQRLEAFSLQFNLINTIEKLYSPLEIKISNNHHCILICDFDVCAIRVYDLKTLEFQSLLPFAPNYFCIEEDYNGRGNDALVLPVDDTRVHKYDLRALFRHCSETSSNCNPIWQTEPIHGVTGVAILVNSQTRTENQVFVCDTLLHCIHIFRSSSGDFIRKINVNHPTSIAFTLNGDLIVSEAFIAQKVSIMSRNAENDWVVIKQMGEKKSHTLGEFFFPVSVMCDKVTNNFLVVDCLNNRIQVFSQNGVFIKCYDQLNKPSSACMNQRTGELFVCDTGSQRVVIFK